MDDQFADYWRRSLATQSILTFGIKSRADVFAENIVLDEEGRPSFDVIYPDGKLTLRVPLLGSHNVMNALASIAAAYAVGATPQAIVAGLTQVIPVSKRLIKSKGLAGANIIDDTYNANPLSVTAALEILSHAKGEKIFVFGDMGELGNEAERFHVEIGKKAKNLGIDRLFAYGKLSELTAAAFGENGIHFEDQASLIAALKTKLHANATVLIKGSRSSRMENIVQAIIQEI